MFQYKGLIQLIFAFVFYILMNHFPQRIAQNKTPNFFWHLLNIRSLARSGMHQHQQKHSFRIKHSVAEGESTENYCCYIFTAVIIPSRVPLIIAKNEGYEAVLRIFDHFLEGSLKSKNLPSKIKIRWRNFHTAWLWITHWRSSR